MCELLSRLVLYCYYTHLFLAQGDPEEITAFKEQFKRDEILFRAFDAMDVDHWFNGKMMYHYYIYKGQYAEAGDVLEKARKFNWSWADNAGILLEAGSESSVDDNDD